MNSPPQRPILLVEDSQDEVAVVLRALRKSGIDAPVTVLEDGAEALSYLRRTALDAEGQATPAAIFLDLRMPRVDGITVLREARSLEHTARVPIVVVSSTQRESEIQECYRLGANSFISKRYGERPPGKYMVDAVRYWTMLNSTPEFTSKKTANDN